MKLQPTEFLSRLSLPERGYIRERLRDETFGGILLLVAAAIALVWSNSAWASGYQSFVNFEFGPDFLHHYTSSSGGFAIAQQDAHFVLMPIHGHQYQLFVIHTPLYTGDVFCF